MRATAEVAKYFQPMPGWIFSLSAQAGAIKGLKDLGPGQDDVLLTDRFFLGDPQMRGFDIRGVGPRVIRQFYGADDDDNPATPPPLLPIDDDSTQDDALGGKFMYLGRAELEIPLGSGAREMGIRPSIFIDAGAVFGVEDPELVNSPYPDGIFLPTRDDDGNALYTQINVAAPNSEGVCTAGTAQGDVTVVTDPVNPNPPACLTSPNNTALGSTLPPFQESFLGDTWKPRVSIGIGINWNSPFGPFRINVAYPLLKQEGDDTKTFTFGVGTQF